MVANSAGRGYDGWFASSLTWGSVTLAAIEEQHLEPLASWWDSPAVAAMQGPWVCPAPRAVSMEIFKGMARNQDDNSLSFAAVDAEATLLGFVALEGAKTRERCATLSVMIGPPYQGQGFGTHAVEAALAYGFTELNLKRIELQASAFNDAALMTYRKVGFMEEGRRRQCIFRGGEYHDQVLMGLLVGEWLNRASSWGSSPS